MSSACCWLASLEGLVARSLWRVILRGFVITAYILTVLERYAVRVRYGGTARWDSREPQDYDNLPMKLAAVFLPPRHSMKHKKQ